MEDDILDQLDPLNDVTYYNKSKGNLKLAGLFVLGAIVFAMYSKKIAGDLAEIIASIGAIFIPIAFIISVIGIINGIKSFSKKEKTSPVRFLILLGNLVIFGIFILGIIANVLDLIRFITE